MADMINIRNVKYYKQRRTPRTSDFKNMFRFNEENVEWLAQNFLGESVERRGGALSSVHRMKICLRYLANPGYQSGIGEELGIEQSTVSRTVRMVVKKIVEQASRWIQFPKSQHAIMEAKELWVSQFRFPTAIGALDCTHVKIEKPKVHGDEYINRKGEATLNVQATCNGKYMFTSVDVSWPGSVHDSRIWKNSDVREVMRRTENAVLIADQGYGIEPWLMTPYREPVDTDAKKTYNKLLVKERVIIEQCFGQLKRRFPILKYCCRVTLAHVPDIIVACIILHNIAKALQDADFEDNDDDEDVVLNDDGDEEENDNLRVRGQEVRDALANIIQRNN